jgi:hypothetical protein
MIIFFSIYLLLTVSLMADTVEDGRAFLTHTPPLLYEPEILAMRPDAPQYKLSEIQLIHKQLEAIRTLSQEKKTGNVTLMIPFLGYTDRPDSVMFLIAPTVKENVQETRTNWPVFSTILDEPNAKHELETYITNQANPLDTRLAAWIALRYLDKDKFNEISRSINLEVKNAPIAVRNYVAAIEGGQMRFRGIEYPEKW